MTANEKRRLEDILGELEFFDNYGYFRRNVSLNDLIEAIQELLKGEVVK